MATDIEIQRRQMDAAMELQGAAELVDDPICRNRSAALLSALHDGRLRVALAGEFGNGKSSVANSLVGETLFPLGSSPAARTPAEAVHGAESRISLVYEDGVRAETTPADLGAIGSEIVGRLSRIEIESPASFLEHVVLVDTPGLGLLEGSAAAAPPTDRPIDPMLADAHCIIWVLNCDRLLSLTERTYIADHVARAGAARLCFVLNHADGKTPDELASLTDRARHLLSPLVPEPVIFPYSALPACRTRGERAETFPDSGELRTLVTQTWVEERRSIVAESSALKIGDIAAAIEARAGQLKEAADAKVETLAAEVARAERESLELQERSEATSQRATAAVQALREQFVVGLKDYALKLRESVPAEVMQVAVDDARRFLPFYIQDSLRRAVSENDRPLNTAVAQALEPLGEEIGPGVKTVISSFQVDVEPPVIPLYIARDRAALTQGASYVLMAASAMLLNDFPLGSLMLAGGLITREIGRQLEAADRRATLADSAQRLVHGSITTIENSVTEQFTELENALVNTVRDTFAPQIDAMHRQVADLQAERAAAMDRGSEIVAAVGAVSDGIETVRKLMDDLPVGKVTPAVKKPRRSPRSGPQVKGGSAESAAPAPPETPGASDGTDSATGQTDARA